MADKPCLRVYDTFKEKGQPPGFRWVGLFLGLRYMVIVGGKYPHGDIIAFGPVPRLALALARWRLRRKVAREATRVAMPSGWNYPPLVREECDE